MMSEHIGIISDVIGIKNKDDYPKTIVRTKYSQNIKFKLDSGHFNFNQIFIIG